METGLHRFDGKTVIVTAAGGTGTGGTLVRRFLAEGARVLASDLNEDGLKALQASVTESEGQRLRIRVADASSDGDTRSLVESAVAEFGGIDVVCNHAGGGGPFGDVVEVEPDGWRMQIESTLTSVYLLSHFALPYLVESGGCIVNTASISGIGGDWDMASYNAAKAGVINLTRSMALDHGADGVRVNAVAPGGVLHPGTEALFRSVEDEYMLRVPLGRFASPEDIAAAITFLASKDASYITGQVIVVDGGITASNGELNLLPIARAKGVL
jgi:meso-butanediol dehydrogenase/(S,S)-butanediol dehydrogenase/diacetyl reductase